MTKLIPISQIKPNPNNPRVLRDEKFAKLKQSIEDFPEMLPIRPIVVNSDMTVLGGNMRLRALQDLGHKEAHVLVFDGISKEQEQEFIIKDNVGFGEWNWEKLNLDFDPKALDAWGLDVPEFEALEQPEDLTGNNKDKPATMKITFVDELQLQKAETEIQELLDRNYTGAYFSVSFGEI